MRIPTRLLAALTAVVFALSIGIVGWADDDDDDDDRKKKALPFEGIQFFFELNDTDGDLGVQLDLGAAPWNKLKILDPKGKKMLEVNGKGRLKNFGLSSLFFESNEPSFDDMTRDEVLALFPEGEYTFVGRTIDGDKLLGSAELSHDIPDAPEITCPEEGDVVDPDDVVVEWNAVTTPSTVEIASYQVIVTNDESPSFRIDVRMPADATSLKIPAAFFEADTEYELEVLAVDENGNQTISVLFFTTE